MTTEEKAKAYDKALERAKKVFNCEATDRTPGMSICEYIFPELQDSENEKIRKAILELVRQSSEILDKQTQDNMINWLEKKGESSEEDLTWLKTFISEEAYYLSMDIRDEADREKLIKLQNSLAWLEKQGNKSVNIDIEPIISSYKQRLKSQGSIENTPLFDMCLTAFRHGVENVLEELNLKTLDPDKVIEWLRVNWWDSHIGDPIEKFKKDFGL